MEYHSYRRAKLFIYGETMLDKGTGKKQWNEKGIGECKFLKHKENNHIRLLMRQEKTMKIIGIYRDVYFWLTEVLDALLIASVLFSLC